MKVWITRYALTKGIFEIEVNDKCIDIDRSGYMIQDEGGGFTVYSRGVYYHGEGIEWHKDKESAIKRADEMRNKKIESLKKRIKELENMKFAD